MSESCRLGYGRSRYAVVMVGAGSDWQPCFNFLCRVVVPLSTIRCKLMLPKSEKFGGSIARLSLFLRWFVADVRDVEFPLPAPR